MRSSTSWARAIWLVCIGPTYAASGPLIRSSFVAIEWTGLGPELLLRLDRDGADTLGVQLQSQLRDAIQSGRLAAGERLPSSRSLAGELGVSRGLVVDTYAQLEAEGYVDSLGGSGTRVSRCGAVVPPPEPVAPASRVRLDVKLRYGAPG